MIAKRVSIAVLLAVHLSACSATVVWLGRSADRRHAIRVLEENGAQFVEVDGEPEPTFDAIGVEALIALEAGRVVYPARIGEEWHVVDRGALGPAWSAIGELVVSERGAHVAYSAERDGRWRVVLDGRAGTLATEGVLAHSLRVSRTGRVAYVARRGRVVHAVIDGVLEPPHDGIASLILGDDGRRVAYVARDGTTARVVEDGVAGVAWDGVSELVVAPHGRTVAYLARRGELTHLVRDRRAGPAWTGATLLAIDPTGAHVAFAAQRGRAWHVVLDGTIGPAVDDVDEIVLGAGDDAWGYVARRAGQRIVVVAGRVVGRHTWASSLVVSAGGGHWAYLASRRHEGLVVSDRRRVTFDSVVPGTLVMDDAGRWSCVVGWIDRRALWTVHDGSLGTRIDFEELAAESLRMAARGATADTTDVLRAWARSDLIRRAPRDPAR